MPTTAQPPLRSEASYPLSYREREMAQIARAIQQRQSIIVCGIGGSGKSHLLRFIAFHPQLPARFGAHKCYRLYLDCNALIADDAAGVFRTLLLETGSDTPIPNAAPDILAALRRALASQITTSTHFVLVLDRFERIPESAQPAVLDGLRHLRDYLDRRVSYVLGSRTPPQIASLSEEFDDLLAAPPVVWLGPLCREDAAWNIAALLGEAGTAADHAACAALYDLSGGHPRLLRAAVLAWAEQAEAPNLRAALVAHHQVRRVCEAILREQDDLSQAIARRLANGEQLAVADDHPLRRYGLVIDSAEGNAVLASELLAEFVRELRLPPELDLTALEQRLWKLFRAQPDTLLNRDDLIASLYGENPDGVNDEALTALVARLRRKLNQAGLGSVEAVRRLGYRFTPAAGISGQR